MAIQRDKLWRTGLPGPRDFEVKDLADGDMPVWDDTNNRWTRSGGSIATFHNVASPFSIKSGGETLAVFTKDAAVALYYDNVVAMETQTSGITVKSSATATFAEVRLRNVGGGEARFRLGNGAPGILQVSNEANASTINMSCTDSGGTARTGFSVATSGTASAVGFHGTTAIAKPAPTGSRAGNAALASLLTALANYGLITDSTSA